MKRNNICKFSPYNTSNELFFPCFVLETDKDVMAEKQFLSHNRMILIEQGEGEFLIDNSTFSFSAGTLIFAFIGETIFLSRGENISYFYIDFSGVQAESLFRRFGINKFTRKKDGFNNLISFCKDSLLSTKQENIDIAAESTLLYIFSRLSATYSPQNDILQKILEITEENFQFPELSMVFIANEIGYNAKYLSHFFKKKMQINYSEYLRSFRFKYAISLFESGITSVKNVAMLSGFSDPLYFSNIFKREIGISPKEFVEQIFEKSKH